MPLLAPDHETVTSPFGATIPEAVTEVGAEQFVYA
jgi:hypothetical protein